MAQDALDPGPNGDYPYWPRLPDGSPDERRMPTGLHRQRLPRAPGAVRHPGAGAAEDVVTIDLTPRHPDGSPITPPTIPPPP